MLYSSHSAFTDIISFHPHTSSRGNIIFITDKEIEAYRLNGI